MFESAESRELSRADLESFLRVHGVALDAWGVGGARTLDDLLSEVEKGESRLVVEKGVVRETMVVTIDLSYRHPRQGLLRLKEARQEFFDGRTKERSLPRTLSEKLQGGETPEDAAERGLAEELPHLGGTCLVRLDLPPDVITKPSRIFPGLISRVTAIPFSGEVSEERFCPEGYSTNEGWGTTRFVWVPEGGSQ